MVVGAEEGGEVKQVLEVLGKRKRGEGVRGVNWPAVNLPMVLHTETWVN